MHKIEVFIFSFNRGKFLKNCIDSVIRHIPNVKITIIDDNSTDKYTLEVLNNLSSIVTVLKPKKSNVKRWGGFYNNINWVIQDLASSKWALFIEDDMQIIRNVTKVDVGYINNYFKIFEESLCLEVNFFKDKHRRLNEQHINIDYENHVYFFRESAESYRGTVHYNNPVIFNTKRFKEKKITYTESRDANRKLIKDNFSKMGVYPYPFMMYLPFPTSTKGKHKTLSRKISELYNEDDFYPYLQLSKEKLKKLFERDIGKLPYASDYLVTKKATPSKIYEYSDTMSRSNFFLKALNKIENKFSILR